MDVIRETPHQVVEGQIFTFILPEGAPHLFESVVIRHLTTDVSDFGPISVRWEPYKNEYMYTISMRINLESKIEDWESAEIIMTINGGMINDKVGFVGGVRVIPIVISNFDQFAEIHKTQEAELAELKERIIDTKFEIKKTKIIAEAIQSVVQDTLVQQADLLRDSIVGLMRKGQSSRELELAYDLANIQNLSGPAYASSMINTILSLGRLIPGAIGTSASLIKIGKDLGESIINTATIRILSRQVDDLNEKANRLEVDLKEAQLRYEQVLDTMVRTGYTPRYEALALKNISVDVGELRATKIYEEMYASTRQHELVRAEFEGDQIITMSASTQTLRAELLDGFDIIVVEGTSKVDTSVIRDGTMLIVVSGDRVLLAENAERIMFDDAILALDVDGNAGQAYRLYQAAFERPPDAEGLSYWVGRLDDADTSLAAIADSFLNSPEFVRTFGTEDTVANSRFIEMLYTHTLGRDYDQDGYNYWVEKLNLGETTRRDLLAFFSESDENKEKVADAMIDGIWLQI